MEVLRARLYNDRLRELVAARHLPREMAPVSGWFACPRCDLQFFLDLEPEDEPSDIEECEWEAVSRLEAE